MLVSSRNLVLQTFLKKNLHFKVRNWEAANIKQMEKF
uniref:Uncharacterized protein n=1 Tax=Rhizophora mucronata TaxID=61149 RepID=A0A2P2PZ67_RHIMU